MCVCVCVCVCVFGCVCVCVGVRMCMGVGVRECGCMTHKKVMSPLSFLREKAPYPAEVI